jgi:hypothetical protein
MSDDLFDIYFSGKVIDENQLPEVKQKIGKLFNANEAVLDKLFSGKPTKIKKAVDMDTAIKYRVKFREAGAIVDIRPSQSAAPPPASSPAAEAIPQSNFTAAEAATPEAVANPVPNAAAVETSAPPQAAVASAPGSIDASLATPGSIIDETPEPPPASYNTDQFDLGEANSGSLEDFAETVMPAPVPDTSALDVEETDAPLDNTPQPEPLDVDTSNLAIDAFSGDLDQTPPPPPANIDTSNLTASEANSGSLEEFDTRPEPVPVPDTSKLDLA